MTDRSELIERLAREAQLVQADNADRVWTTEMCDGVLPPTLERFAALVAAECARLCRQEAAEFARTAVGHHNGQYDHMEDGAAACEQAIRERFGITEG